MYYFQKDRIFISAKAKKHLQTNNTKVDFSHLEALLTKPVHFNSERDWNKLVEQFIAIAKKDLKGLKTLSTHFATELKEIERKAPLTEPTPWGGVVYKKIDVAKDYINKLLVVRQYGVLGFEYHKKKLERLDATEGIFMMFYSNHKSVTWKKGLVSVKIIAPGDHLTYDTYDEHGLIALTNGILTETSTNHLDDLIFIYNTK